MTNRLARAVLRARALGGGEMAPWQFALLRLSLDGVDTMRWLPLDMQWMNGEKTKWQ